MLLHGFEQGRLGFWGSAVDLVCQDHIGKNRSWDKPQLPTSLVIGQYFCASDVGGHQVGSELNATEFQMESLSNTSNQQCLCQSRCSGDQAMGAREQADQQLLDHLFLSNNCLFKLSLQQCTTALNLLE